MNKFYYYITEFNLKQSTEFNFYRQFIRSQNLALKKLMWNFTEMIKTENKVIPENWLSCVNFEKCTPTKAAITVLDYHHNN